jgi:ADP-ribose pyrophosphatase
MTIVYRGRVFSVEAGRHTYPNGREFETEVVRHAPSVVIVPMADPDHVMLVGQYRPSIGRHTWELPAGSLREGEGAEAAASRESEEEIGLVPDHLVRIRGFYPAPGFCDEELIFFLATDLRQPPPDSPHKPDDDEDIQVRTVSLAEARRMVADGTIVDLKTAYGLTLV